MQMLKDDAIHSRFLLGRPVHVEGIGDFHSPSLVDVVELTEDLYNTSLSLLLSDKNTLANNIKQAESNEEFANLFYGLLSEGFKLHFGKYPNITMSGIIYFDEISENSILTDDKMAYIRKLVRIANNIAEQEKEEEYIPGNDKARQFIEEQKRRKAMVAKLKKPKINLRSIISAVGWKHRAFGIINQLSIYQLYDGYYREQVIDNYKYTMSGIYAGTVDSSKIKLDEINWANINK